MTTFWKCSFVTLIVLFFISLGFNVHYYKANQNTTTDTVQTVTIKYDTIKDTVPVPKIEKMLYVCKDTFYIRDTITNIINPVAVDIPITQKTYTDDSTYTAYVSGYKQKLDSIEVYRKNIYIDRTITKIKKDNRKFNIGPVIYGGYSINNNKPDWGIGIGLSYGIWKF